MYLSSVNAVGEFGVVLEELDNTLYLYALRMKPQPKIIGVTMIFVGVLPFSQYECELVWDKRGFRSALVIGGTVNAAFDFEDNQLKKWSGGFSGHTACNIPQDIAESFSWFFDYNP